MTLEDIYDDIIKERITFGEHLNERMWENGISIDQVLDTIQTGQVTKREKDERSRGRYTKFTIRKGAIVVTVKDCDPSFIITVNRRR
jgi:hypothetical protein